MTLVARSDDLARLVNEGYDIEVRGDNLLVHHVPYVTSAGEVEHCILCSELTTNGERTIRPGRHEVWVIGDIPHDHQGNKLSIVIEEGQIDVGGGLTASCRMSRQAPQRASGRLLHQGLALRTGARPVRTWHLARRDPHRCTAS